MTLFGQTTLSFKTKTLAYYGECFFYRLFVLVIVGVNGTAVVTIVFVKHACFLQRKHDQGNKNNLQNYRLPGVKDDRRQKRRKSVFSSAYCHQQPHDYAVDQSSDNHCYYQRPNAGRIIEEILILFRI